VGCELAMLVVIGTDCIGSCKSNYLTITTAPWRFLTLYNSKSIYLATHQNLYLNIHENITHLILFLIMKLLLMGFFLTKLASYSKKIKINLKLKKRFD